MIRRVRLAVVIVVSVVLQTTLFTHLRVDGVAPELGLVCVLAVAYEDGANTGAVFGFVMGLAMDLFLTTPLGLSAMSYAITGYAGGVVQAGIVRTSPWIAPAIGGVGGLFGGLVFISVGAVVGQEGFLSMASLKTVLISALFDALIAPIVFPIVRRAAREPEGAGLRDWGTVRAPRWKRSGR
jgi:rod shape-determining protein MreD